MIEIKDVQEHSGQFCYDDRTATTISNIVVIFEGTEHNDIN